MSTIVGLSTGRLPSGIAIIRISGPLAFGMLPMLVDGTIPPPRYAARRRLVDPKDGGEIDTAIILRFVGPASATGDDVVELHLHGGIAVVDKMLEVLLCFPGVILADRGAFARRAFDNGRLDLFQAEQLADLIEAQTDSQRRLALTRSSILHQFVESWRSQLIEVRASVEAILDFEDENDVRQRQDDNITDKLIKLRDELVNALAGARRGNQIRDGLTIALIGPANTGKSSLVNLLVARKVSIVAATPGTTRDVIEARVDLGGVAVTLLDTAGIRCSTDPVELAGIRLGQERAEHADLVIAVGDLSSAAELKVVSMCDVAGQSAGWHTGALYVSSVTGDGIDLLVEWLVDWAKKVVRPLEPVVLTHSRHAEAVQSTVRAFDQALSEVDTLLVAEHLRNAATKLAALIDPVAPDDILDAIFARFCIGK